MVVQYAHIRQFADILYILHVNSKITAVIFITILQKSQENKVTQNRSFIKKNDFPYYNQIYFLPFKL